MNKAIKKVVAFGVGASMLLGTAASAVLAADLSAYPSPFVQNGVFGGKIVIGEKAASIDTVGALDIAASLQRASATTVSSAGAATQIEGSLRLDTSSDRIYLGSGFSIDSAVGTDLSMLEDGSFEDDEGTLFEYTQSIVFNSTTLDYDQFADSDEDAFMALTVNTNAQTTPLYTAKIDFTKAFNVSDSAIVGNKVVLFGNEYTFSSDSTSTKLVLYGSSEEISIGMGEEVTKTVSGKEYKIKVIGFSTTKVTVQVNGETYSLAEDSTKTFGGSNGLRIYAKSVDSWDGGNAGTTGFATLQLGAEKVTLENGESVKLGTAETDVEGTYVMLGKSGSDLGTLNSIHIGVGSADSDLDYLKAGSSFVDPVFKTFKIVYSGNTAELKDASKQKIAVDESGSTKLVARIPGSAGEKSLYFVYQSNAMPMVDSDSYLVPIEGANVTEDDYTYLAPTDPTYTHLVKVANIKTDATTGYVEYTDFFTGVTYKTEEGNFDGPGENLKLTVDGKDYRVYLLSNSSGAERVAVLYNDNQRVVYPEVELANGETFFITAALATGNYYAWTAATEDATLPGTKDGIDATITAVTTNVSDSKIGNYLTTIAGGAVTAIAPAKYATRQAFHIKEAKDNSDAYNTISINTTIDGTNPGLGTLTLSAGTTADAGMADDDTDTYVDVFGSYIEYVTPSGDDSDSVTIYVPADQVYANVFLAPLAASISTSSTSGAVSLNPISLGLAILDSEATLGSKPYIVVGGPCANTVAAALMGNGADCAAGFTEGKAMIKLFSDKNALLVAGYSGKDTQAACRVLASYKDPKYALSGTEMEVVTTNLQEPTVRRVSS